MRVTLDFPAAEEILQEVGLDEQGDTQMFHTKNVLRRIQKYMPYRTGATIKLTVAQTDPRVPEIVTEEPQVVYLYNGVSRSGKPLNYSCRRCGYLHWWEFLGAFHGIGDGLFAQVVNIRNKRARGKMLDKSEQEFARENAAVIKIHAAESVEDKAEKERLLDLLGR